MAPTATGSKARWAPQARHVWAGARPQRAARTGAGAYRGGLPPTACFFSVNVFEWVFGRSVVELCPKLFEYYTKRSLHYTRLTASFHDNQCETIPGFPWVLTRLEITRRRSRSRSRPEGVWIIYMTDVKSHQI